MTDQLREVREYHRRTKHTLHRYAAGPGYLDWESQPNPIRRFDGCETVSLPFSDGAATALYRDLFRPAAVPAHPLTPASLGALLEHAFGLSAWKQFGADRWALRCNPSSGNLHPTEAYVVASRLAGLPDGVYHYVSHDHVLERRCRLSFASGGLLVGLSSIHWRESWKYGERAYRYCQLDIGHALGALRYGAAALGWRVRLLDAWSDADIALLLGLDREADYAGAEREEPALLCLIESGTPAIEKSAASWIEPPSHAMLEAARAAAWQGRANALSVKHYAQWPAIDVVSSAAAKPRTAGAVATAFELPPLPNLVCTLTASEIIKQRRSAQAFDGGTAMSVEAFFRLLEATLPCVDVPPFDGWPWPASIHLVLFVHRVAGLDAGLYLLCRSEAGEALLRDTLKGGQDWPPVSSAPPHLRLFRMLRANVQEAARTLGCHQEIASDGAFSLAMLADFDANLDARGAWTYRRLFWECGLVGQALYLEAEAAGMRGTGIGCFFDDSLHELLGVEGASLQSLYHFTVGKPLLDSRLETLPAYEHLVR